MATDRLVRLVRRSWIMDLKFKFQTKAWISIAKKSSQTPWLCNPLQNTFMKETSTASFSFLIFCQDSPF